MYSQRHPSVNGNLRSSAIFPKVRASFSANPCGEVCITRGQVCKLPMGVSASKYSGKVWDVKYAFFYAGTVFRVGEYGGNIDVGFDPKSSYFEWELPRDIEAAIDAWVAANGFAGMRLSEYLERTLGRR